MIILEIILFIYLFIYIYLYIFCNVCCCYLTTTDITKCVKLILADACMEIKSIRIK